MQHSVISMEQNTTTTATQEQAPFLHKHKRRVLPLEYASFDCKRGEDLSEVTRGYYFSYHMMHSRPHLCKDLLQISEMHFTWLTTSKVLTAPSFLTGNKGLSDWKQRPFWLETKAVLTGNKGLSDWKQRPFWLETEAFLTTLLKPVMGKADDSIVMLDHAVLCFKPILAMSDLKGTFWQLMRREQNLPSAQLVSACQGSSLQ